MPTGAMQMGLGADDLVAAVPLLMRRSRRSRAETVSRVGSHSLSFDQIHALAKPRSCDIESRRRRS
jgi:L-asparaginase